MPVLNHDSSAECLPTLIFSNGDRLGLHLRLQVHDRVRVRIRVHVDGFPPCRAVPSNRGMSKPNALKQAAQQAYQWSA